MFVCTANTLNIPAPLLDRMEVIRLPGYTEDEKLEHRAALPAAEADEAERPQGRASSRSPMRAILDIIRYYTREAGVRNLEREIVEDLPQGGQGAAARARAASRSRSTPKQPRQVPRRAALPLRPRRGERPRRPGHRARLDRGRRRAADDRSGRRAGQGQADAHRPARRSDAGVDPGGDDGGAQPRRRARPRAGLLPEDRRAHARARRRDAEGRPERRHRHVHGAGLGADARSRCAATSR